MFRQNLSLLVVLVLLSFAMATHCEGQTIFSRRTAPTPNYRTIITYNGQVLIVGERFDMTSDGRVVFKEDGMRFSSQGYVWSPIIPDKTVREGHYTSRVVGSPTQYWPPLSPNETSSNQLSSPVHSVPGPSAAANRKPSPITVPPTPSFSSGLLQSAKAYNAAQPRSAMPTTSRLPQSTLIPKNAAPFPIAPTYCTPMSTRPECQAYVRKYRRW